ncbi:pogo transposable protein [Rutstroemia sp. NJR-2017a WRK4]|nr:pogo transposable protein [Rutstroemia sp. NJR-2017a WRK4]
MDETGVILYILGSIQVLVSKDDPRDYRGTGIKYISIDITGPYSLPLGSTIRTPTLDIQTPRLAWSGSNIYSIPRLENRLTRSYSFGIYKTLEAQEFCFENNIIYYRLPSYTSYKLQPYDIRLFAPLKGFYYNKAERLIDKIKISSYYQDEILQIPIIPISIAESALLYDEKQILTRINNKAKVRRSTRSLVLGQAKVISFEDIEVARAARTAKDVIKGKGKRGRKRKSAALEAGEPEPEPEPEVARMIDAPVPWRAPVARMI